MNLPGYAPTRPSGFNVLGEVPQHWEVKRLRFAVATLEQGWSPQCDSQPADDDCWGVMKVGCVNGDGFDPLENKALPSTLEPRTHYELRPRDILISRANTKELLSSAAIVPADVRSMLLLCDKLYRVTTPPNTDEEFLTYYLRTPAARFQYEREATGASDSMQNISQDTIKNLIVVLPPFDEQQKIAAFLDWKTGQIDALIGKKKELLETLTEKRIALITQAVTRGLNPAAPVRDSGIPWLGQVPEHWRVCQIKRMFASTDYGISESLEPEGTIAILRMGNIENGKVALGDLKFIDAVPSNLLLRRGDLLYNRTNSLDLIGKVGMFRGETDFEVSFASYLVRIRIEANCVPEYFAYLLNTEGMLGVARANAFIAIGQCNLNPSRYGQIKAAVPPKLEQEAIVAHLDSETAKLDELARSAQAALDRLNEYRTALITAGTTGQIDVRNVKVPARGQA